MHKLRIPSHLNARMKRCLNSLIWNQLLVCSTWALVGSGSLGFFSAWEVKILICAFNLSFVTRVFGVWAFTFQVSSCSLNLNFHCSGFQILGFVVRVWSIKACFPEESLIYTAMPTSSNCVFSSDGGEDYVSLQSDVKSSLFQASPPVQVVELQRCERQFKGEGGRKKQPKKYQAAAAGSSHQQQAECNLIDLAD